MAPRAIWKGAISFGMVVIPVKLYPATQSKDIAFVTLHGECHNRIRQKRYCPYHEIDVALDETVRGYEYSKEQYVVMEKSDFEDLPVPSTHTIEIVRFVDLASIDPVYFERSYVLEPETVGQKPFFLLKRALESSNRVAIAKVSLRQKEHLCCLRPYNGGIAMATMYYPDEVRANTDLELPDDEELINDQEMAMANTLIDQLTGPFEPEQHRDEYRVALERVIEAKLGSGAPVTTAPAPPPGKVVDLMEALRASIQATKGPAPDAAEQDAAESEPAAKPRARSRKKAVQKVG